MPACLHPVLSLQLDGDSLAVRLSALEARRAQHEAGELALRWAGWLQWKKRCTCVESQPSIVVGLAWLSQYRRVGRLLVSREFAADLLI